MHATSPLPTSDVGLFADDVLHDPYPAPLGELREVGPSVRLTTYDAWGLPRYDHVRAAPADQLDNVIRGMASLPVRVRTEGQ
ncbi:hypothetical protein [Streptomyces sporangiiformans]|uniref:hypothetical protein n=1 Tax=Streptomyces sporangiiformans TaxID=2315329 RepID=UPI001F09CD3E|nr:hypothetical protein [Streptomyces sporangiiformans]